MPGLLQDIATFINRHLTRSRPDFPTDLQDLQVQDFWMQIRGLLSETVLNSILLTPREFWHQLTPLPSTLHDDACILAVTQISSSHGSFWHPSYRLKVVLIWANLINTTPPGSHQHKWIWQLHSVSHENKEWIVQAPAERCRIWWYLWNLARILCWKLYRLYNSCE